MNKQSKISYYELVDIVQKNNNTLLRENILAHVKPHLGTGFSIWNDLGNGIGCALSNYKLINNQDIYLTSKASGAVLIFNLGTDITYKYTDQKSFTLKKNSFIMGFSSNEFYANISLDKQKHYNTLTIGIKEDLFLELANNLDTMKEKMQKANQNSYDLLDGGDIDPEQFEILGAFLNETLNKNLLDFLYLESKVTNLTHYTIKKVLKDMNKHTHLDKNILKSIRKAKEIIYKNFASQLSIKEIAYKSAINECYLKKDFKNYYGMTVYEMIQKQRLEASKSLLKEGISVKEVAQSVGYKHAGNFSKLFTENYGLSPSIYRKKFIS